MWVSKSWYYDVLDQLHRSEKKLARLEQENHDLRALCGLYEACITKGVEIDFPNSDTDSNIKLF